MVDTTNAGLCLLCRDHILTRGDIVVKCHSTAEEKLIAAILDKFGDGAKSTCPDEKLKVVVKDNFTVVSCFYFAFFRGVGIFFLFLL